jgi:hypothetical protein
MSDPSQMTFGFSMSQPTILLQTGGDQALKGHQANFFPLKVHTTTKTVVLAKFSLPT